MSIVGAVQKRNACLLETEREGGREGNRPQRFLLLRLASFSVRYSPLSPSFKAPSIGLLTPPSSLSFRVFPSAVFRQQNLSSLLSSPSSSLVAFVWSGTSPSWSMAPPGPLRLAELPVRTNQWTVDRKGVVLDVELRISSFTSLFVLPPSLFLSKPNSS